MITTNIYKIVVLLAISAFLLPKMKGISQDLPQYELKSYVDENGRLYWPIKMPVYLFASEEDSKVDANLLNSERSSKYSNPLYFGQEGLNKIVSKWAIDEDGNYVEPRQDVVFEVWVDGTAPTTNVSFLNAPKYKNDKNTWYGKELIVELSAKDNLVGIEDIFFAPVGSDYQVYNASLSGLSEGEYNYNFFAVDKLGHVSDVKSVAFGIDLTAPKSSISAIGNTSSNILSASTILKLYSRDDASKVKVTQYKIDNQPIKSYDNEIGLNSISEGNHTLTYYAIDNVNNQEQEKKYDFYLDRTPPIVLASILGDQYQNRGRVFVSTRSRVKLDASDNKAGLQNVGYRINDGTEKVYIEPFNLPKKEGKYEIVFYAKDKVNNAFSEVFDERKHGRQALEIDLTAPEIGFAYIGQKHFSRDTMFISPKTKVDLLAKDTESGIKKIGYKVNKGPGITFDEPFSLSQEGSNRIDYYATDNINNRNIGEFNFVVDGTGPSIFITPSMKPIGMETQKGLDAPIPVISKGSKIFLAATDSTIDVSGIYFSINDQPETVYSKPIVLNATGIVVLKVRAVDLLGNETKEETKYYFVK